MSIIVSIFKWVFPDGLKHSSDYKLLVISVGILIGSVYISGIRADEELKKSEDKTKKEIELKETKINAKFMIKESQVNNTLTSQHTIVLNALKSISENQKEIKDQLKIQDQKLWRLSRDVKKQSSN